MEKNTDTNRIREILKAIARVARGDYTSRVEPSGQHDELDSIAAGFNMMVNEIRTRQEDLEEQREEIHDLNTTLLKEIDDRIQAESLYQILAENSPVGVYIIQNGQFCFMNRQFTEQSGYTQEELFSTPPLKIVHPDDTEWVREHAISMLKEETDLPYEFRIITKSGEIMWSMETVASIIYHGQRATLGNIMNITERKRSEERLQLLSSITEQISDATTVFDTKMKITYVNRAAENLFGYSDEELLGKDPNILNLEPIPESTRQALFRNISASKPAVIIREKTRKDGSTLMCQCTITPLYDVQGEITSFIDVQHDITEQLQNEKAMRFSDAAFKSIHEGIIAMDADFTITFWNDMCEEILGIPRSEAVGKNIGDVISMKEESPDQNKGRVELLLMRGHNREEQIWFTPKGEIWLDIHSQAIEENGTRHGWVTLLSDITERKKIEESLRESEEKFSTVYYSNPSPMVIFDTTTMKIVEVNDAYVKNTGYSREECIGETPDSLHLWVNPDQRKKLVETTAKYNRIDNFEIEMRTKSGEIKVLLVSSERLMMGGKLYMISSTRDITDRKRMEKELQATNDKLDIQNEELQAQAAQLLSQQQELVDKSREVERANQLKSEFLASMSHELRTPLNAVIGFSELMLDGITGEINEEQRECLADILGSGQHLLELINDVLDLSKVEAGKMEFKPTDLFIDTVIDEALQTVKPMLNEKEHTLSIDIEEGLPQVYADRSRLRQILLNLLSNAVKFTPQKGKIGVSAVREGNYCRVTVTDNGIGIKKEDIEKVFEVFTQVETIRDETKKGTGLGLSITRQFIETMGGRVWAESEYGKGSSFIFTTPLIASAIKELPSESSGEAEQPQRKKKVLLVDDDGRARRLLSAWLKDENYTIIEAANADDGVKRAEETAPDVIVLDLLMPEKDGWHALKALKSRARTRAIPVIIASVSEERELALSLGAMDYFTKPINKTRFKKRIAELGVRKQDEILVVDDNPKDIRLISAALEAAGIKVISASGGEEGIRVAKEQKPSLIVLDILMPDLTGFEVIDRIQEDEKTNNIPIVVMTAKDLTEEEMDRLSTKTQAVLHKSTFSRDDFLSEVKKLVEHRSGAG